MWGVAAPLYANSHARNGAGERAASRPRRAPGLAGVVVGWSFLIATYYLLVMYFAIGPNRVTALLAPRVERGAVRVRSAARRTAGWAKRVHWGDPESMLEVHC